MFRTLIKIDGMSCSMCESHVNDAIRNAFKVKKVKSSHKKGLTEILSQDALTEEEIRKVLDPTGYRITEVSSEAF